MLEASILLFYILLQKGISLQPYIIVTGHYFLFESYFFWIRYTRYIGVSRWTTSLYTYYKLTHTGHFSKP